jgi:predicted MPP superfamily phosphohydrolase
MLSAAALALAAAVGAYGAFVEPRALRLRHRDIQIPGLRAPFDGYRIAHLSDPHLGAWSSGAEHVLLAASLRPDVYVVTGDLIEREAAVDACAHLLGSLEAPDGVVCVLGNHDHDALRRRPGGTASLLRALAARGVRTLVNEALAVERSGERLWLVGVDDPYERRADVGRALAGVPPGETVVLLAHSPDVFSDLPAGRADLVLTGHCHGGQVRTPWGPIFTRTRRRFRDVLGVQRIDGTLAHMSGGLGATIPFRLLSPPEATVLRLRAASAEGLVLRRT